MKVLIDTNIILDALLKRTPFDFDAYNILKMADENRIHAYIAAFSITDIYYFISKHLSHEERIKAIKALFNIMDAVSVTKTDIEKAMVSTEFKDLEDSLQMQCLRKIKGDFIITRDDKFQKTSSKAISPKKFIQKYKKSEV